MIQINLLPGTRRATGGRRQAVSVAALSAGLSGRLRDKFMVAAVVGVIVALGAVATLYLTQGREETALSARLDNAVRDSARYANFLTDRYHAEAVRDTLLRQVNIIRGIDNDRYIWPHIMDEVSRALPQYTWLTLLGTSGTPQGASNVVITPKTPQDTSKEGKKRPRKRLDTDIPADAISIRLEGRTVDIQALTRFMRDLAASPFLTNVQIDKSELALDQGKEVTQFQLTLGYRRPDTTALRRVPLSMTGR